MSYSNRGRNDEPTVQHDTAVEAVVYGINPVARRYQILPGSAQHRRLIGKHVGGKAGFLIDGKITGGKIEKITRGAETAKRSKRVPAFPA